MELNPTSHVLLGALSMGSKTGYGIKAMLDKSTRFFWATSYGQIYPELKRLAEAGLIVGEEAADDGRRRIEYRITPIGQEALRDWLRDPPEVFEMRDEGLLKLFFAAAAEPEDAVDTLREMQERREELERQLRELVPKAEALSADTPYPLLVLRAGIEYARLFARWCEQTADELSTELDAGPQGTGSGRSGAGATPNTADPEERNPNV